MSTESQEGSFNGRKQMNHGEGPTGQGGWNKLGPGCWLITPPPRRPERLKGCWVGESRQPPTWALHVLQVTKGPDAHSSPDTADPTSSPFSARSWETTDLYSHCFSLVPWHIPRCTHTNLSLAQISTPASPHNSVRWWPPPIFQNQGHLPEFPEFSLPKLQAHGYHFHLSLPRGRSLSNAAPTHCPLSPFPSPLLYILHPKSDFSIFSLCAFGCLIAWFFNTENSFGLIYLQSFPIFISTDQTYFTLMFTMSWIYY